MNYTARRVSKGSKKVVEVLDETGAVVAKAGGKRAERAQAVVLSIWLRSRYVETPYEKIEIELRADVDAARGLAAGYLKQRLLGHRDGEPVYATAATAAEVLLIEEVA